MADLLQVLVDTSATITHTFQVDGAASNVDSGLPTLTLTRPDGTAFTPLPTVLDAWAGPPARSTGQYRFVLDAQPEVTWLDYELTGVIGGKTQKLKGRVEWLGALLFTIAELRDYAMPGTGTKPFTDTTKYPDAKLHKARAATLSRFTKALGFSPVPRLQREVHSLARSGDVILGKLFATDVLSVTVAGVTQVASNYLVDEGGRLLPVTNYTLGPWTHYGYGNLIVEYVHGTDLVDDDATQAALQFAAARLNPSGFSSATTYTSPDGMSVTYEPSEVGRSGFVRFTGIRDVDRFLNLHAQSGLAVA